MINGINLINIILTGYLGGLASGLLGIGCGIIIVPALSFFGIPPFIALASQLCHSAATNFNNFLHYAKNNDVDFQLAFYIVLGGCVGAFTEWIFLKNTSASQIISKARYIYVCTLFIFGIIMLCQSFNTWKKSKSIHKTYTVGMHRWMLYLPFHKIFTRSRTEMSILIPIFLGFLTGILVAALGGGNNLFMAPIITYLIGRISPTVYGTTALAGLIITSIVAIIYANNHCTCDISLVLSLFSGAIIGAQCGIFLFYKIPRFITNGISSLVIFMMACMQLHKIIETNSEIETFTYSNILNPEIYTVKCLILVLCISYIYNKVTKYITKKIH